MSEFIILTSPVELEVVSDLVIIGYNPENADMDNPQGAIFSEAFYLTATLSSGKRFANVNTYLPEQTNEAFMFRSELKEHIKNVGSLPSKDWREINPAYGSNYYVSSGAEEDLIAWEHKINDEDY